LQTYQSHQKVLFRDDQSDDYVEENYKIEENYKNKAYWALPENVRHAIDISKKKSRHSAFYNRMNALTDKISVYK
jgi:hypothetical protein